MVTHQMSQTNKPGANILPAAQPPIPEGKPVKRSKVSAMKHYFFVSCLTQSHDFILFLFKQSKIKLKVIKVLQHAATLRGAFLECRLMDCCGHLLQKQ